jgi:uncharacterized protein (TIGR03435 family)
MTTSLRRVCVALILLIALAVGLRAQDLTGTWQGTGQLGGRALRIVIKIATEGTGLRAIFYSIDQNGQPVAGTATVQGENVRMAFPGIGATFEGRLSDGAATLTGAIVQGPNNTPLTLAHVTADAAWEIPPPPRALTQMPATATPQFEVATIKPSQPNSPGPLITFRGRQFITGNTSLAYLTTFAYGLHPRQITLAPEWVEQDRFDIAATMDTEGMPNDRQTKAMVQKLLSERFKLTFHREQKELAVYALTVGRSGSKLTASAADPNGLPGLGFRALGSLSARNASMTDFANVMQSVVLDRPVVNQTGLAARYDFTLTWAPDDSQFGGRGGRGAAQQNANESNLFTAIQEQLGLRLEPARTQVEVLAIDRVEKPTEN